MKRILLSLMAGCAMIMALASCNKDKFSIERPYTEFGKDLADVEAFMTNSSYAAAADTLMFWEYLGWCKAYTVAEDLSLYYVFDAEDGKNLKVAFYEYKGNTVPVSEVETIIQDQGFVYEGHAVYPQEGQWPFNYYLSGDGKVVTQVFDSGKGEWVAMYSSYKPEDFKAEFFK
ncbi:MAG: hypothetical protein K6F21_03485 [Bacteroidales bacterium]|nr:hypothetical protein [Bacteroidales bacterium]